MEKLFTLNPVPETIEEASKKYTNDLTNIEKYRRAANYIAGAQIFLKENVMLTKPLAKEHIKDRLLGHWGTCPGINLVYAHCNRIIKEFSLSMLLVTGPGHGAPANIANLYLEGTMEKFFPECSLDERGLHMCIKAFSWPRGFASHLTAHIPGSIHEGGELGYCLSVAFGSVIDNPDLITTCIVGDGEAETGPLATSWNSIKYLDPKTSGAVIPILHVNGYKITSPTIFGSMDNHSITCFFTGLGYQVLIVEDMEHIDADMYRAMNWALAAIKKIQKEARESDTQVPNKGSVRWPVIVMKTYKGWTGIKELHGKKIENTWRAHQVPAPNVKSDKEEFAKVEEWLRSYKFEELFTKEGPTKEILSIVPTGDLRMGMNPAWRGKDKPSTIFRDIIGTSGSAGGIKPSFLGGITFDGEQETGEKTGRAWDPLVLPSLSCCVVPVPSSQRGKTLGSCMKALGTYLEEVVKKNPYNFRVFSPDELASNKLDVILDITKRQFEPKVDSEAESQVQPEGRVLEILSEHTLQGWLQGYLLTGRNGVFPSYEAFLGIVATMMDQYAKFLKMSFEVSWRPSVPSLIYIASSTLWRQEHNGFSHQNPGFINTLLNKKSAICRIYFPPDANTMTYIMSYCLSSRNKINLVYGSKNDSPQWLNQEEAANHCKSGASVWKWASTNDGVDPDVVLVGCGVEPTIEIMAAAHMLQKDIPDLKVRVVNVVDLMIFDNDSVHPHGWSDEQFNTMFTSNRPIIINFHGYPSAVKQLLFSRFGFITSPTGQRGDYRDSPRFYIHGYIEEGTTTTPLDMAVANQTSRFHIAMEALKVAGAFNSTVAVHAAELITKYKSIIRDFTSYIVATGTDPVEPSKYLEDWPVLKAPAKQSN